ncbi:hypothetical protein SAG0136_08140 [Streptococcus agalactiae LMG 14747]|uniref:Phage tail protein n=1 Tax=Streptococcus agalactiae LMG 14747 TaxID=1154860 RepID=V6Z6C4_STRAG|nr:hypothetical protein SAG0136_08140 [Streptococcus agalactiae LMG 14747]
MSTAYFIFNGQKSTDFDLAITTDIKYKSTSYDIETIEIEGRDGVLLKDKHRLKPVEQEIPMKIKTRGNVHKIAHNVSEWLNVKGWQRLEFSWDSEHYYLATFAEGFDVEEVLEVFGNLKATFLLHPIKFRKDGEKQVNLTSGMVLTNLGNYPSKPIFNITGNGDGTITVNGRTLSLKNVQGSLIVDAEKNMVYYGQSSAWDKIVRTATHSMPFFDVGKNIISWTGNFTITCQPNWGVKI